MEGQIFLLGLFIFCPEFEKCHFLDSWVKNIYFSLMKREPTRNRFEKVFREFHVAIWQEDIV